MSVASVYAKALFGAASDAKTTSASFNEMVAQLDSLVALIGGSKELQVALYSPVMTGKEKSLAVATIASKMALSPMLTNFLVLLARKGRFETLPEVCDAFRAVRLDAEGGVAGELVAAGEISSADVQSLAEAFGKKLGKRVAFEVSTDPTLLAGVKVTVGGVTYDGTLRSQLQRLRDRLATETVE